MKKLITLLLVLVLTFSLFAGCKKKNQDSTPTGESTPVTSENGGESTGGSEEGKLPEGSVDGAGLSGALAAQFDGVSSAKIELDLTAISDSNTWIDENGTYVEYNDYSKTVADVTILVSKDANGIDATVTVSGEMSEDKQGEATKIPEMTPIYVIDNTFYVLNENVGGYVAETEVGNVLAQLEGVLSGDIITSEEQTALYNALGEMITATFDIKNFTGSLSVDLKPSIDSALNYLKNLDLATETVGGFANDVLSALGLELTVEQLVDKVEEFAGYTVNEAIAKIGAWLTTNFETTIQGIYDELVADERIMSYIVAMAQADMGEMTQDDLAAFEAQVKALKVTDLIAQYEIGNQKIFDLIIASMGSDSEAPTKDEVFQMVDAMLALPLAEFETSMETPIFSSLKMAGQSLTVNALNWTTDIKFTNTFAIDYITEDYNVDIAMVMPSQKQGAQNSNSVKVDATLKISEISKTALSITKPTNVEFYDFYAEGSYESQTKELSELNIYDGKIYFYVYGEDGSATEVSCTVETADLVNTRIEIAKENVYIYMLGNRVQAESDLVIVIDPVTNTYVIESGLAE